jgi:hypothetical protein
MSPRERKAKAQEQEAQDAGNEAAQAVKDRTGVGEKPPSDPEHVRQEIEETREDLGDTVEALAAKADVKARTQERAEELGQQARENPTPLAIGGAVAGVLLILWLWRKD